MDVVIVEREASHEMEAPCSVLRLFPPTFPSPSISSAALQICAEKKESWTGPYFAPLHEHEHEQAWMEPVELAVPHVRLTFPSCPMWKGAWDSLEERIAAKLTG